MGAPCRSSRKWAWPNGNWTHFSFFSFRRFFFSSSFTPRHSVFCSSSSSSPSPSSPFLCSNLLPHSFFVGVSDRLTHSQKILETSGHKKSAGTTTAGSGSRVAEASTSDYRVAVFGAGGVGKSSITQRFVKGTFNENYVPTIEDTYRQVISCNVKNVCTLQITDTTGSHQFPAMQRLSVSKGNAFILIYSVTNKQSMAELAPIIEMLKEVKGPAIMEVPIMLVGNKKDEESKREVSTAAGEKVSAQMGCGFIETSAKNNENITELFQQLLAREKKRQLALTMDDPDGKNGKKRGCRIM